MPTLTRDESLRGGNSWSKVIPFWWEAGSKYDGSGASKYEGVRWIRRYGRISGNPMITSMQLSITLAFIFRRRLSVFVTSLKRVKSKATVPYIELLCCVPARPTVAVGISCLLDLGTVPPATVYPSSCCSSHFATSLLTNEV